MKTLLSNMPDNVLVMDKTDPQNLITKSKNTSLADVFIFNRIANSYERKYPLFFPYNQESQLDSTIHKEHTWRHKIIANEIIQLYDPTKNLTNLK